MIMIMIFIIIIIVIVIIIIISSSTSSIVIIISSNITVIATFGGRCEFPTRGVLPAPTPTPSCLLSY